MDKDLWCFFFFCQLIKAPALMYPFLFESEDFSSGLAFRPYVSAQNGHRKKASFQKRSPEWRCFKNATLLCSCGRMKTELFEKGRRHSVGFSLARARDKTKSYMK